VATPNYSYEKRQRELAKKRKKEEKAARKASGSPGSSSDAGNRPEGEARGEDTPPGGTPPAA
jgi:hypothetical protein